jgi:hypothetical protein
MPKEIVPHLWLGDYFKGVQFVNDKIRHHVLDLLVQAASNMAPAVAVAMLDSLPGLGLNIGAEWFKRAVADLRSLMVQTARRDKSARIIQQHFRSAVSDPTHPICQRRLLFEFQGLAC